MEHEPIVGPTRRAPECNPRAEEALPILVESKSPDATMVQAQLAEWRKNGGA